MHIKGIKRGSTIELLQEIEGLAAIPDGTEVVLTLESEWLKLPSEDAALTSLIGSASGRFETAAAADAFMRQERDGWES